MGLKIDHKYHGTVRQGSEIIESQSGSLGYQVMLTCEDGDTSYTIWLTAKNRDRAEKDIYRGAGRQRGKTSKLPATSKTNWHADITGREVTFVTEQEEYRGKTRIKVAWLFKRSASGGGSPAKAVAGFFGKKAPGQEPPPPASEITDDDIPF
jgi:hypothetical protein